MSSQTTRIPWFEPVIDADDVAAVDRVVASGFVNEGPENREFEKELCTYFDVPYAVTTPSCTMALALSVMAHGIGHGDKVLVPAITFIGTASAVRLAGAEVVLVDVDPETFTIRLDDAASKINSSVKAIIPVHLTGRSCDMNGVNALAEKHGLAVIEDAAEALGSRNERGWLGAQSHAGCFSLAPTKIITSGQGGFVLTRSETIRDQLIRLRDHGRLSRSSDVHPVTGFNFKVTDMQAALARSQWRKLDRRIKRAKEIDARYQQGLDGCADIACTARPESGYLMWPDFKSRHRDAIVDRLKTQNIHLRPYWPGLHMQPAYQSGQPYPGADVACRQACWLPCSPDITDEQIDTVIAAIRNALP
ncbi:MAG TPA: DegT/DnrJ/EryC1/StrS family aminotransferase [Kiritimatiellia bacterium]|nr:DegT/DnrJ/EryC1/StrS family aminotransferase [Kiritimatiellia bacterium]